MGTRHRLDALTVKNCKHPGATAHAHRLSDGGGLYLQVTKGGTKSWLFRYTLHGRPTWLGLGSYGEKGAVSLSAARTLATEARQSLSGGANPHEQRKAAKRASRAAADDAEDRTFAAISAKLIEARRPEWKNAKHAAQWAATLKLHAFPVLGAMPVADIGTEDVRRVLDPIWTKTPETAQRLRGRIEAVLDYAKVKGFRSGDNPATWRGHLAVLLTSPRAGGRAHQPALGWNEITEFMAALAEREGVAARALGFLILTAARTSEAIGARWGEIDLDAAVWTVPANRMKARREHRVPLSAPAVALLREQLPLANGPGSAVFQSGSRGKGTAPMSNMALLALLRRMNPADKAGAYRWHDAHTGAAVTAHGFRSTFRDWVTETTDTPSAVAEAALAPVNKDKTEAAYARGDLFAKRAQMMAGWGAFCVRAA